MNIAVIVAVCFLLAMAAIPAYAAERLTVVFFSGLCNSAGACAAEQQASASIAPRLPQDATLINAQVVAGRFQRDADVQALVGRIGAQRTVLVAYSAGHQGLLQLVNAMSPQQLQKVRSIVSLESNYNGFNTAVNRVREFNPNVEVHRFGSAQFGTNHSYLPGAAGTGDAIAALARSGLNQPDSPTSPIPTIAGNNPATASYQNPATASYQTPPSQVPYQSPAAPYQQPSVPLSAPNMIPMATGQNPFQALQQMLMSPPSLAPIQTSPSAQAPAPAQVSYTQNAPQPDVQYVAPTATPSQNTVINYQPYSSTTQITNSNGTTFNSQSQESGFEAREPEAGDRWSFSERLRLIFQSLSLRMRALLQ